MVSPGLAGLNNGVGTLTFNLVNGDLSFQKGSFIYLELSSNHTNDKIVFTASGTGTMDFSAMAPGSLSVNFAAGYTPSLNDTFDLFDWSAVSGLDVSLLNIYAAGFDPSWTWDTSQFTSTGVISIVALAPEPARALLLLAGIKCLFLRRRRPGLIG